ncbi:MAG: LPS translocon maturation chaperone LptM [Candidatus Methylumidiphilus sp.]
MSLAPRIIASFAIFSLLGACGLKGPLYLPPPEVATGQPGQEAAKDAQSTPAKQAKPVATTEPH